MKEEIDQVVNQEKKPPGNRENLRELTLAVARRINLAMGAVGLSAWLLLGTTNNALLSALFLALGAALAGYLLLSWNSPLRAENYWRLVFPQLYFVGLVTLALVVFPNSIIQYFYLFTPFIAVLTFGLQGGVIGWGIVSGVIYLLSRWGLLAPSGSTEMVALIVFCAIFCIVAWAAASIFYTQNEWAYYYINQGRHLLEEARLQRVELLQTQEDLIKANQELARLNQRQQILQQAAEEARQVKMAFVANVSHEFRAPLNMIIGFSEMISRSPRFYGGKVAPALLADIAAIQRNAVHLSRLIEDVLDLSQIDSDRMALSKEWVRPADLVAAAVEMMRPTYQSKGLSLEARVNDGLPEIFCDGLRIRQILINLLSNAFRFTNQGGATIELTQTDKDLLFSVTDTGTGISKENQEHLFQPFHQADTSIRRNYGGSGLGLSISKQFIEMHGGKITVKSEPGQGTTFRFTLPTEPGLQIRDESRPTYQRWTGEYAVREARSRPFHAKVPRALPRLLVAGESGGSLAQQLTRHVQNLEVNSLDTIESAVLEADRSPVEAVLLNTSDMGNVDDLPQVAGRLRQITGDTPALACWLPGREDAALAMNAEDYLIKPLSPGALLDRVAAFGPEIKNILVVDDDSDLLRLYARVLDTAPLQYRVWQCENGQEALDILRSRKPDLLIIDLIMPVMDGYSVMRKKDADEKIRDIPTLVISSTDPAGGGGSDLMLLHRDGGFNSQDLIHVLEVLGRSHPAGKPSGGPKMPVAPPA